MRLSIVQLMLSAWLLLGVAEEAIATKRILLIAVDAIPYDVAAKLTDPELGENALFKGFRGPVAVINTFPTGSYVAWTGLLRPLGAGKALGYEACHFSLTHRRLRGCFSLITVPAPWKEIFDWYLKGLVRKAIAYGWPKRYSLSEIDQGLDAFLESEKEFFSMYIVSTDGLGHVYGPDGLAEFLRELDRRLQSFRRRHPDRPFQAVIVSDHGMPGGEPLRNTWPQIKAVIKQGGFRLRNSLKRETDVTLVKFGLLSSFVGYTWQGREEEVAALVASVPGVDLCVIREQQGWKIISARGNASIGRRAGPKEEHWSYQTLTGDPLGFEPIVAQLRSRAQNDSQRWFPDSWWFEASKHHYYPDALYRLAENFALVENPASLACSNSQGYMFGSLLTERVAIPTIGRLKWTHGALHDGASLGFLMTDIPDWPIADAVRFDRALDPLVTLTRRTQ